MQNPKPNYLTDKPPFSSPARRPADSSSLSTLPTQQNQPSTKPNIGNSESKPSEKPAFQGAIQGLSFANPFGHPTYNKQMSRSYVKKDVTHSQMQTFMKDTREKFFKISKSLFEHEQIINQLREKSSSTASSVDYNSGTSDSIKAIQRQLQSQQLKTSRIFQQIDRVRAQINDRFLKKDEFEFNLNRFELRLIDNFALKKQHTRQLNETRDKFSQQIRSVCDFLRKQIESNILHIHQTNRDIFSKIQRDMLQLRQATMQLRTDLSSLKAPQQSVFTSNKKCYDPRIVKYRETVQKVSDKPYEKPGQEMAISQTLYFLDRDGYLLDKNYNYLVDSKGSQLQLDQKHIQLLKLYNLLN